MELFDSHAHYDDEKFAEDRYEIIDKVYNDGITKLISAGYDVKSSQTALSLTQKYDFIYTIAGISPNDVKDSIDETNKEIDKIEEIVSSEMIKSKSKLVGIGEIGLDFYWNQENKEVQKDAFIKQIQLANKYNLPIVIHTREAVMDTLEILKNYPVNKKGVFHCCPFNRELVKEGLKLGFYISFAGPTTFKNSKNASEIIELVPNDRILIETDSPYLAPEPKRGTRNDSRNVKYIAEKIAEVKNMTLEEIAEITYQNTLKAFDIQ
jgi:TatD DNase family protein